MIPDDDGDPFACPIPWCTGRRDDHGNTGESPLTWLHSSSDETLGRGRGFGNYSQQGGGVVEYYLHLSIEGVHGAGELRGLAQDLRVLAATLDARAATLDELCPPCPPRNEQRP